MKSVIMVINENAVIPTGQVRPLWDSIRHTLLFWQYFKHVFKTGFLSSLFSEYCQIPAIGKPWWIAFLPSIKASCLTMEKGYHFKILGKFLPSISTSMTQLKSTIRTHTHPQIEKNNLIVTQIHSIRQTLQVPNGNSQEVSSDILVLEAAEKTRHPLSSCQPD